METILDEFAQIYFESPKMEKKRLKTLFHKAFRGTKNQISIKSQNPHLEFQVHLRTLLCFGYINNINRTNRWNLYIPTDIKLLITIFYPDVFKAPMGINLSCSVENFQDIFIRQNNSFLDIDEYNWFGNAPSNETTQSLFDTFDVDINNAQVVNSTQIVPQFIDNTPNVFDHIGYNYNIKAMNKNMNSNANIKSNSSNKSMQLMLSRNACMDDIFCDGLNKMNHLFQITSNISGCNPYKVETSDISILCFKHGKDKVLQFFKKLDQRYENVSILSLNCYEYEYMVVATVPTKIVTINVSC